MRQNCRPQTVNFASRISTITVLTAAIVQALAIQIREVPSSLPQSSVGVNMSMRARYRLRLVSARLMASARPASAIGVSTGPWSP